LTNPPSLRPPPQPPPPTSTVHSTSSSTPSSLPTVQPTDYSTVSPPAQPTVLPTLKPTSSEQPFDFLRAQCLCHTQSNSSNDFTNDFSNSFSNAISATDILLPKDSIPIVGDGQSAKCYSLQFLPTRVGTAVTDSGASLIFMNSRSPFIIPNTTRPLRESFRILQGSTSVMAHQSAIASFTFQDRRDPSLGIVLTVQAILLDDFRPDLVLLSHSVCHVHNIAFMLMPPPYDPYGFVDYASPVVPKDPDLLPRHVRSFDCPRNAGGTYDIVLFEPNSFLRLHSATTNTAFSLADDVRYLQKYLLPHSNLHDIDPDSLELPKLTPSGTTTSSNQGEPTSNSTSFMAAVQESDDPTPYLLELPNDDLIIPNASQMTDSQLLAACTSLADSTYSGYHEALVTFTNKLRRRVDIPTSPPTSESTPANASSPSTPTSTNAPSPSIPTENASSAPDQPQRPHKVSFDVHKNKHPPYLPRANWPDMLAQDDPRFGWKLLRCWWYRQIFMHNAEQMERTLALYHQHGNNIFDLVPGDSRYLAYLEPDPRRQVIVQNAPLSSYNESYSENELRYPAGAMFIADIVESPTNIKAFGMPKCKGILVGCCPKSDKILIYPLPSLEAKHIFTGFLWMKNVMLLRYNIHLQRIGVDAASTLVGLKLDHFRTQYAVSFETIGRYHRHHHSHGEGAIKRVMTGAFRNSQNAIGSYVAGKLIDPNTLYLLASHHFTFQHDAAASLRIWRRLNLLRTPHQLLMNEDPPQPVDPPLPFFISVRYNPPHAPKWSTRRTREAYYLFPARYSPIKGFGEAGLVDNKHESVLLDKLSGDIVITSSFQAIVLMEDNRRNWATRLVNNARSTAATIYKPTDIEQFNEPLQQIPNVPGNDIPDDDEDYQYHPPATPTNEPSIPTSISPTHKLIDSYVAAAVAQDAKLQLLLLLADRTVTEVVIAETNAYLDSLTPTPPLRQSKRLLARKLANLTDDSPTAMPTAIPTAKPTSSPVPSSTPADDDPDDDVEDPDEAEELPTPSIQAPLDSDVTANLKPNQEIWLHWDDNTWSAAIIAKSQKDKNLKMKSDLGCILPASETFVVHDKLEPAHRYMKHLNSDNYGKTWMYPQADDSILFKEPVIALASASFAKRHKPLFDHLLPIALGNEDSSDETDLAVFAAMLSTSIPLRRVKNSIPNVSNARYNALTDKFASAADTLAFHTLGGTANDLRDCVTLGILHVEHTQLTKQQQARLLSAGSDAAPTLLPSSTTPLLQPFRLKQELEAHGYYSESLMDISSHGPLDPLANDNIQPHPNLPIPTAAYSTQTATNTSKPLSTLEQSIWNYCTQLGIDKLEGVDLVFDDSLTQRLALNTAVTQGTGYNAAEHQDGDLEILKASDIEYKPESIIELRDLDEEMKKRYLQAIIQEVGGCADKGVWTISILPPSRKSLPTRLVLKAKYLANGEFDRLKQKTLKHRT